MYTMAEKKRMWKNAEKPVRETYVGPLDITDMRIVRKGNGDVVIEGIDPNNMGRLEQKSFRMSAEEWEVFVHNFAHIAKFI